MGTTQGAAALVAKVGHCFYQKAHAAHDIIDALRNGALQACNVRAPQAAARHHACHRLQDRLSHTTAANSNKKYFTFTTQTTSART
eukprot:1136284-Pelagomonas_calceolata.AAC.1